MLKTFSYYRIANFYETDAAKIVHFSNFFRYVEEAELEFIDFFYEVNCSEEILMRSDFVCDFFKPILFDQEFKVELNVVNASPNVIHYEFTFYIEKEVAAKGSYSVKCIYFCNETKKLIKN